MRTHGQIIRAAGAQAIHDHLGLIGKLHTVRSWVQRDSIPAEHWAELARLNIATLEELADAADARRRAREGKTEHPEAAA